MKYIVTKTDGGTEEIFLFPDSVYHKDMADAVSYLKQHDHHDPDRWRRIHREPVSAGFVEGGECVGLSESLGLRSRPQDTAMLPH